LNLCGGQGPAAAAAAAGLDGNELAEKLRQDALEVGTKKIDLHPFFSVC
jgi:hypothetical protein